MKHAYLIARRLVGNEAARDVAQETWIKYRTQARREGEGWTDLRARAWIRAVAANGSRSLLRKSSPLLGVEADRPDPREDDPAEVVACEESERLERELVERLLAELPREKRNLLTLRDLEGRSWRNIAQILDENERTLRSRYTRLRAELRQASARLGATREGDA